MNSIDCSWYIDDEIDGTEKLEDLIDASEYLKDSIDMYKIRGSIWCYKIVEGLN